MVGWVCAHTLLPQRTQQLWTDECTWKQVRHLSDNSVWTKWWLVCVHHRNVDQKHLAAAAAGMKTGSQEFWRLFWAGSMVSLVQNNSVYFSDVIFKEWSGYCESAKEKSLHVCETRSCLKPVSQGGERLSCRNKQTCITDGCHGNNKSCSGHSPAFMGCPFGVLVSPQLPPPHSLHWSNGTQPHTGSCRCCLEWAWCRWSAVPQWSSGWICPRMWWDWSPTPDDQTSLNGQ